MKNIFRTIAMGTAILSFTACTQMIGQLTSDSKMYAANKTVSLKLDSTALENSAEEQGYKLTQSNPGAFIFEKSEGSTAQSVFGYDHENRLQVMTGKNQNGEDHEIFNLTETSNTDKITVKSVKKDLDDFIANYKKELKAEK